MTWGDYLERITREMFPPPHPPARPSDHEDDEVLIVLSQRDVLLVRHVAAKPAAADRRESQAPARP